MPIVESPTLRTGGRGHLRARRVFISPSGVRSIRMRHDLASFKKRLLALERHVAKTGEVLTEVQVTALERKQATWISCATCSTRHRSAGNKRWASAINDTAARATLLRTQPDARTRASKNRDCFESRV